MLSDNQAIPESDTTSDTPNNVLRMEIPLGVIIIATYIVLGHCLNQGEVQLKEEVIENGSETGVFEAETQKNVMDSWHGLVSPFH